MKKEIESFLFNSDPTIKELSLEKLSEVITYDDLNDFKVLIHSIKMSDLEKAMILNAVSSKGFQELKPILFEIINNTTDQDVLEEVRVALANLS